MDRFDDAQDDLRPTFLRAKPETPMTSTKRKLPPAQAAPEPPTYRPPATGYQLKKEAEAEAAPLPRRLDGMGLRRL